MIQSHNQVLKQTDASKKGWGTVCQGISTGGQRSYEEQLLHINVLELKTVKLALLTFTEQKSLKAFHFQIDNATALLYLVKMVGTGGGRDRGGREPSFTEIKQRNLAVSLETPDHNITAEYLPSSLIVEAIWQSRNSGDPSEWKL